MIQKSLIIFAIVILVLSPTYTYSTYDLIKKDTSEGQNISFYCQDSESQLCCTQLAHRVSRDNHSRCASIVLTNNSGYNMTLVAQNLEDGRWITSDDYGGGNSININCQPRSLLLVNESETISSVTSHFFGGVEGYISYIIHDNMTSKFIISWKVTTIGSPQYDLSGLSNHDYEVKNSSTFEDTVYQVTINAHTPEGQNNSFYCKDGTSQLCCSQLAHRVSSENHSRCASIVLTNNSGYNMTLVAQNLEDGRWITSDDYGGGNSININCQPRSLLVNESETISSVSSHFLGGLKGYVSYNIHDNMTSKFTISWNVPTIGSPQYNLSGLSNNDYEVKNSSTFEDTVYQITINAYDLIKNDISKWQIISFFCQDGTSQLCCSQLAHQVSSDNRTRCTSIVLKNNSGYNMTLVTQNLEDGRWITSKDYSGDNSININCQPRSLLVNESETISSIPSHFFGGMNGYASFNIHDNMKSEFNISWKVPSIGLPQYDLNGLSNYDYHEVKDNMTSEDTVYQITINKAINKNEIPWPLIVLFFVIAIFVIISCYCFFKRQRSRSGPPSTLTERERSRVGPPAIFPERGQRTRSRPPAIFPERGQRTRSGPPPRVGPPAERGQHFSSTFEPKGPAEP